MTFFWRRENKYVSLKSVRGIKPTWFFRDSAKTWGDELQRQAGGIS
jgi:hypothetical protein